MDRETKRFDVEVEDLILVRLNVYPIRNILTRRTARLKACHFKIGLWVAPDLRLLIAVQISLRVKRLTQVCCLNLHDESWFSCCFLISTKLASRG